MDQQQLFELGRRSRAALPAQPVAGGELGLDRADALRVLGVGPRVVLQRRRMREQERRRDGVTVPAVQADLAVVGAGAAGLQAALTAAREGARVVLVSRSPLAETASYWAQGGIAAALAADDSPELHRADTLAAGRATGSAEAAGVLCEESPDRVAGLIELGVRFDSDRSGALALGLEGGHSRRRVVHAGGSSTGRRVTRELSALVATDERIEVIEPFAAGALWCNEGRCVGLVAV